MGYGVFARLGAETSKARRVLRLGFEVLPVGVARVSSGGGVGGEVNLPPSVGSKHSDLGSTDWCLLDASWMLIGAYWCLLVPIGAC